MDINLWAKSITDGRKVDFFILFAINILLETHMAVYLKNGEIWSMLERQPMDHNELLNKCNFHMAYVGRGLFVELTKRKHPIIIVDSTDDIKAIDMCCLTYDESENVDSIIFKGLRFGKDPDKSPNCTGVPFIKDLPWPMIKCEPPNTKIQDTITVTSEQSSQKSDKEKAEPARKEKDLENKSTDDKPAEDDMPVSKEKDLEDKLSDDKSTTKKNHENKSQGSAQDNISDRVLFGKSSTLVLKIDKLKLSETRSVTVTPQMIMKLPQPGY